MSVTADPSSTGPLLDALARLPAEQRVVIRRSYYDAWTVTQIAADLQVDETTVTARLHYGVRALLLSLEERGITRPGATRPLGLFSAGGAGHTGGTEATSGLGRKQGGHEPGDHPPHG